MKLRNLLFLLLTFCFVSQIHTEEHLDVRCLITNEEGVFLQVGERWLAGEGFLALGEGSFVLVGGEWIMVAEALQNPDCIRGTWKCSKCGFINYEDVSICPICGKHKRAK